MMQTGRLMWALCAFIFLSVAASAMAGREGSAPEMTRASANGQPAADFPQKDALNALRFDGLNDYIRVDNMPNPVNAFTLEAWAKLERYGARTIVSKIGSNYYGFAITYDIDEQRMHCSVGTLGGWVKIFGAAYWLLEEWRHVALVYGSGMLMFYENGELQGSAAAAPRWASENFKIGDDAWFEFWDGDIDEVRYWTVARSQAEIRDAMCQELTGTEPGLVAYYKLNESGSAAIAADAAGGDHPGTLAGFAYSPSPWIVSGAFPDPLCLLPTPSCTATFTPAPTPAPTYTPTPIYTPTPAQNALQFDGLDDYVNVDNVPNPISAFTLEAWVKLESYGIRAVASKIGAGFYGFSICYNTAEGRMHGSVGTPTGWVKIFGTAAWPLDQWRHVALVYDSGTLLFYENGALQGSAAAAPRWTSRSFKIGNDDWNEFWDGGIDEVRYWTVARSQAEILAAMCQELTGTEPGLTAYYKMNESESASTAADAAGGDHPGALSGFAYSPSPWVPSGAFPDPPCVPPTPTSTPSPTPGEMNALRFDGSDDYINVNGIPDPSNDFTLEAWVKLDSAGACAVASKIGPYYYGFSICYDVDVNKMYGVVGTYGGWVKLYGDEVWPLGQWRHVALTCGAGTLRYYENGRLQGSVAVEPRWAGVSFKIGNDPWGNNWAGDIDEVRYWTVARGPGEIGEGMCQGLTGSEPGLVAYYKLNESESASSAEDAAGGDHPGTLYGFSYSPSPWISSGAFADPPCTSYSPTPLVSWTPEPTRTPTRTPTTTNTRTPTRTPTLTPTLSLSPTAILEPNALRFDGTFDYVEVNGVPNPTSAFTLEAWVKLDTADNCAVAAKIESFYRGFSICYEPATNQMSAVVGTTYEWIKIYGETWPLGQWRHVALVYDAGTVMFYENGQLQGTAAGTAAWASANFRIGNDAWNDWWDGDIDEVRYWLVARSQEEILGAMCGELTGTEPGLVAYYRLNHSGGAEFALDAAGGDHTGTLIGFSYSPSPWVSSGAFSIPPCAPFSPTPTPSPTAEPTGPPTPTPTASPEPSASPTPLNRGDVNGDGSVTPGDALLAFLFFIDCATQAPTAGQYAAADFCGETTPEPCDGSVTPADALGILKHYLLFPDPCAKGWGAS